MVQVEKNGIVLLIPMTAFEADYKNYGWKILNEKQEKPVSQEKSEEKKKDFENKKQDKVIDSKKNKNK